MNTEQKLNNTTDRGLIPTRLVGQLCCAGELEVNADVEARRK